MKRALLFPSYFGGGSGHVARCLALAAELSNREWAVGVVVAGHHAQRVRDSGYHVFSPRFPSKPRPIRGDVPPYTYIPDMNIQALRDGFLRPWRFYLAVKETTLFVKRFRPHVLIGDFCLLTCVLGKRLGLPVVQISQSVSHPIHHRMIWWEDPPPGMVSPDIKPVFNPVLSRWDLDPVDRVEDLLQGDLLLVPGIPELDRIPDDGPNTYYLGHLLPTAQDQTSECDVPKNSAGGSLVYVTVGGGSVGNHHFFNILNLVSGTERWRVIVSTGRRFDPSKLPAPPPNVLYHRWVDGRRVMKVCHAVVFHGGHQTMMETVHSGIPSIVVPFHSEQEQNGRRLEACSAALVLAPSTEKRSLRLVHRQWRYGQYSTYIQPENTLTPEMLREALRTILKEHRYSEAAKTLSDLSRKYGGPAAAVDLIDRLV